jgi:phenylalanyl-tRNA synthetase beta chain
VTPPLYRQDIVHEADLIEEVGRVYGLDRIAPTLPAIARNSEGLSANTKYHFLSTLRSWGAGLGLNEVINYSFVGHKDLDLLGLPADGRISIMNPLSSEQSVLRTALVAGLLNNLRHNIGQGHVGLRLFETARIFFEDKNSETTANERGRLGILLYGRRFDAAWPQSAENVDYSDIKGLIDHLLRHLNLPFGDFILENSHSWLNPCVRLTVEDCDIGFLGQVKLEIADAYHARMPVWVAELDTDCLRKLVQGRIPAFRPLPQYPPVRRDITVMCPETLRVEEISEHILGLRLPWLEEVQLVDVFVPEDKGERNLTFRLTFRHAQRTLKDIEVDKERERVAQSLVAVLPVRV